MGREVKRVALDFDWPMNITWKGYVSPYSPTNCKVCDGSGLNEETKLLNDQWYTHLRSDGQEGWARHLEKEDVQALWDANRLREFKEIPTPEEVNKWSRKGFGHDAINQWVCVKAKAQRLGFYGDCHLCNGKGYYWADDKYDKLAEEWEQIDPPAGKGWQMWETTSEGSPMSPVFKTPEELARWLADTNASSFGSQGASYELWLGMIKNSGWACSAVMENGVMKSGVEAFSKLKEQK